MVAPILDELAGEYEGKVTIGKVNIDDHQSLAIQYRINSIPTLLFFKNGEIVDQVVGLKSKKDFKAKLDQLSA
jgi:thioredoxin 1